MQRQGNQAIYGFTLVEILLALAIFAILSLGGYQILNQVQRSNQISEDKTERLKALQRAVAMMDADFRQMAQRPFRHEGQKAHKAPFYYGESFLDSESQGILFTRLGWVNPRQQFPRGEILKVGYRTTDDKLERLLWRYPDTQDGEEPLIAVLLEHVTDLQFKFYHQKEWGEEWTGAWLPEGISVTFTSEDYGDIERVYVNPARQPKVK